MSSKKGMFETFINDYTETQPTLEFHHVGDIDDVIFSIINKCFLNSTLESDDSSSETFSPEETHSDRSDDDDDDENIYTKMMKENHENDDDDEYDYDSDNDNDKNNHEKDLYLCEDYNYDADIETTLQRTHTRKIPNDILRLDLSHIKKSRSRNMEKLSIETLRFDDIVLNKLNGNENMDYLKWKFYDTNKQKENDIMNKALFLADHPETLNNNKIQRKFKFRDYVLVSLLATLCEPDQARFLIADSLAIKEFQKWIRFRKTGIEEKMRNILTIENCHLRNDTMVICFIFDDIKHMYNEVVKGKTIDYYKIVHLARIISLSNLPEKIQNKVNILTLKSYTNPLKLFMLAGIRNQECYLTSLPLFSFMDYPFPVYSTFINISKSNEFIKTALDYIPYNKKDDFINNCNYLDFIEKELPNEDNLQLHHIIFNIPLSISYSYLLRQLCEKIKNISVKGISSSGFWSNVKSLSDRPIQTKNEYHSSSSSSSAPSSARMPKSHSTGSINHDLINHNIFDRNAYEREIIQKLELSITDKMENSVCMQLIRDMLKYKTLGIVMISKHSYQRPDHFFYLIHLFDPTFKIISTSAIEFSLVKPNPVMCHINKNSLDQFWKRLNSYQRVEWNLVAR